MFYYIFYYLSTKISTKNISTKFINVSIKRYKMWWVAPGNICNFHFFLLAHFFNIPLATPKKNYQDLLLSEKYKKLELWILKGLSFISSADYWWNFCHSLCQSSGDAHKFDRKVLSVFSIIRLQFCILYLGMYTPVYNIAWNIENILFLSNLHSFK